MGVYGKVASTGETAVRTYVQLSQSVRHMIDGVVQKYSNFANAMPESTPMVTAQSAGTCHVQVIGTFDHVANGDAMTAVELDFAMDGQGLISGSLQAKDAFGSTVWRG